MLKKERNSNLELFRILVMLVIIAHHYVVNSHIVGMMNETVGDPGKRAAWIFLFGWGGKTGLNCFVMITGYFMCTSHITARKYAKMCGTVLFYNILVYVIFLGTGYQMYFKPLIQVIFPIFDIRSDFVGCYLLFYLFIPFLNILIQAMNEKQHLILIALGLFVFSFMPGVAHAQIEFNYVSWFCVIYLIAAYFRLYPRPIFDSAAVWGLAAAAALFASWLSVLYMTYSGKCIGSYFDVYWYVADSNKPLAAITAVCAFMAFKNLKIGQHKWINKIGASTFGVLLLHANCDAMRQWLWHDTLRNSDWYNTPYMIPHALLSVAGVFIICSMLEMMRIRWVETPIFRVIDRWTKSNTQEKRDSLEQRSEI